MKSYIKLISISILILVIFLLLNINQVIPGTPLFAIKRVEEKVFYRFKFSNQAKVSYQRTLLERGLVELESLAREKRYNYILEASLRYSATAGQLTELVMESTVNEKEQIITKFKEHQKRLDNLYLSYPADDTERKYILDCKNYLDLYTKKLQ